MQKYLFLISFIFLLGCGSSYVYQTPSGPYSKSDSLYASKYSSFLEDNETIVNSWYHYLTSTTSDGKYVVRVFYPEKKQITSLITYDSKTSMVRNGLAKEWYDDGSRLSEGNFVNNKKDGSWKYYQWDTDLLQDSGRYSEGEKQGTWHIFDDKGRLSKEFEYVNGEKDGYFFEFDSLRNIINKGIYRSDTIFQEETPSNLSFDEVIPSFAICDESEGKPDYGCGDLEMALFVREHFEYPEIARELFIQGTAYIQFVIEKDGSVTNVKAIRGVCDAVKEECVRLIESMPNWEQPGMQAGEPVSVRFTIPIRLKLG